MAERDRKNDGHEMHTDGRDVPVSYVELSVPGAPGFLSLIRLNTGSIASRLDVTLDELEDLQLAVDELCLLLLGGAASDEGRLHVRIDWEAELVEVRCRLLGVSASNGRDPSTAGLGPASLSRQILDALVDEHGADVVDGVPTAWLRKHREHALPPS
jgi:hypothetical protein